MEKETLIRQGETALGIEFGSTRIKAVLTDLKGEVLAVGTHDWENSLVDGIWTYSEEEIRLGLQDTYKNLKDKVKKDFGITLQKVGALGISAMMHGYLALDQENALVSPFQTWRNSNTQAAADELTEAFGFNIPLRWTVAHLYQCMLDHEEHLKRTTYVTTLDSYVHLLLTGEKVTGIGDAAGIFPIDSTTFDYDANMMECLNEKAKALGYPVDVKSLFPKVLVAGERAGELTEEGARLLDPEGDLCAGIPMCPPEGDAGTGMVATNSVAPRTGNVSAGTSTFAMVVLEKPLQGLHREIDLVTTPEGYPVAMAHANNGTSDLNAWVHLFEQFGNLMGMDMSDKDRLYKALYENAYKNGDADCGGLLPYGYLSGEGITNLMEGRPLFARTPDSNFTLANFFKSHLYTSLGAVKLGMDILKKEDVVIDRITGHGGFFKTPVVGQAVLAAAIDAPVTVMEHAGEGGPWGMALLAAYMLSGAKEDLGDYLQQNVFSKVKGHTLEADPKDVEGFGVFARHYQQGLLIEKAAVEAMDW